MEFGRKIFLSREKSKGYLYIYVRGKKGDLDIVRKTEQVILMLVNKCICVFHYYIYILQWYNNINNDGIQQSILIWLLPANHNLELKWTSRPF